MRRAVCVFLFLACTGPDAPDDEVCRDLIERVCFKPYCESARSQLALPEDDCLPTLLARTGCDEASFTFTSPSREQFLTCREPLVRVSGKRWTQPSCEELGQVLSCAGMAPFLRGEE